MTRAEYAHLWTLRLLGAAEPSEVARLDADLAAGVAACLEGRSDAEATMSALASSAPSAPVPAGARDRLLAAVRTERAPGRAGDTREPIRPETPTRDDRMPHPALAWGWRLAPAAIGFAIVIVVAAILVWRGDFVSPSRPTDPAAERLAELMRNPAAKRWTLAATEGGRPLGVVWHDPDEKVIRLFARGLGAPPNGKTYVLWKIAQADPSHPTNVGVVRIRAGSAPDAVVFGVDSLQGVAAFAISEETDAKAAAPTSTAVRAVAKGE
jgi:hypothetical protein